MVDHVPQVGGPGAGVPPKKLRAAHSATSAGREADSIEISSDVMRLRGVQGIRLDKVLQIRRAIANGTYLTAEKLDLALDRAIDDAMGLPRSR